jgi:hypothetical protein
MRDKGANAQILIAEMNAELDTLVLESHVDLVPIRSGLSNAIHAFEEATARMIATYDSHPREAAAGALPFLMLMGAVTGGWQMARGANRPSLACGPARRAPASCGRRLSRPDSMPSMF